MTIADSIEQLCTEHAMSARGIAEAAVAMMRCKTCAWFRSEGRTCENERALGYGYVFRPEEAGCVKWEGGQHERQG